MSKFFAQEKVLFDKSEYDEVECVNYKKLSKEQENNNIEVVAISCQNVSSGRNEHGNILARVSIVNSKGETIYDKIVKPPAKVKDYCALVSDIQPEDIEHGEAFAKVKKEVAQILKNKLLVAHSPERDLKVLEISHPKNMIRDISKFKQLTKDQNLSLKQLAIHFLKASIREGEPSSVQDAKAVLQMYMLVQNDWKSQSNLNNSAIIHKQENNDIEIIAIDCERLGKRRGTMLARVSIVNCKGETIYDKFVKPTAKVKNYRTSLNGIQAKDIEHGEEFSQVKKEVTQIFENKLLVGHLLERQFKALWISHPEHMVRDISTYPQFMQLTKDQTPSLKRLAFYYFETILLNGENRSVQNAKTALQLYMLIRNDWELKLQKINSCTTNGNKP